ncbi:MFS transporter [Georgenia sp. AZ-5]|uniref:MFS transporter n=1 Tax=Georgenia sp. AZ-5 TaxID=3367526 RepID=UPI00375477E3
MGSGVERPDVERASVVVPLTVLVLCGLLVLMQLYVAIPLAPVVGRALGGPPAAATLGTAYSIAYALGFLVFPPLSDRFGRKVVLVPGVAGLAVATALVATASSLPALGALRAVQGLVAASFASIALAYIGEAFPPHWRSAGVGAVTTAFLVAGIAGQVYAGAVALGLGWRWVFGLAAPALALTAAALAVVLVEPVRPDRPVSVAAEYRALGALAVRRELALPYVAAGTTLLSFVTMYAALGPLLRTRYGLSDAEVLLVRLAGLPGMALAPLAGWLVGRLGAVRVAVAGFLVAAAGLAVEALLAGALWALVAASAVYVAGIATVVPALIAVVAGRAGPNRGGALGLGGLMLFAGASLGPLVAGLLPFPALMLVLAGLLAVGASLVAVSAPRGHVGDPPGPSQRPAPRTG